MRLIAALLLSALSLASASPDQTPATDDSKYVQGKYFRKGSNVDYIELRADGVMFLSQGRMKIDGKYKVQGDTLILSSPKMRGEQVGQIRGNTITDPDGMIWERQSNALLTSPGSPDLKETEASIERYLRAQRTDQVVTKSGQLTQRDTHAVDTASVSDCHLTIVTTYQHELYAADHWLAAPKTHSTYTISFKDLDQSQITTGEYDVGAGQTKSKPAYYVQLTAADAQAEPFLLDHVRDDAKSSKISSHLATTRLYLADNKVLDDLASAIRREAQLCGAPAHAITLPKSQASTQTAAARPADKSKMTNDDVINMVAAGLSDNVVATSVRQAADRTFDLTPTALIALKKAHVPDAVIEAMQEATATSKTPPPLSTPTQPKYDASITSPPKSTDNATPQNGCSGIEMMGLYKNEIFNKAMGGGVVEWLAKIRNNTSVTKIVIFGWIDSYGQEQRSQIQLRGGDIASPRVDMTRSRYIAPVRDLKLLSCE